MKNHVMYKYHDEFSYVNLAKVLKNIRRSYWFPHMRTKVERHIKNCLNCVAFSAMSGKAEGFIHNIAKRDKPFINLHIDI